MKVFVAQRTLRALPAPDRERVGEGADHGLRAAPAELPLSGAGKAVVTD
jgi:hypothetical protein